MSIEDAREAIRNVSAYFDLLARWERGANEEVSENVDEDHGTSR